MSEKCKKCLTTKFIQCYTDLTHCLALALTVPLLLHTLDRIAEGIKTYNKAWIQYGHKTRAHITLAHKQLEQPTLVAYIGWSLRLVVLPGECYGSALQFPE